MKFAVIFPGQGSQKVGMGHDLFTQTKIGQEIFKKINTIAGKDLSNIIFNGPVEELNQTKNTQIAIVAISVILVLLLQEKITEKNLTFNPFACCGHSLGELTALWYANIIDLDTLLKLVLYRGKIMQNAPDGGMAAVLNITSDKIEDLLKKHNLKDKLVIANYNSPYQLVISGNKDAISLLPELVKTIGGKTIILPVSGAFHSPLMNESANLFISEINKLNISNKVKISIYQNYDSKPSLEAKMIIEKLKKQMTSPVLWTQTINNLVTEKVSALIEIGPGKVLTGLIKKIDPKVECYNIQDLNSLNDFIDNYEYKLLSARTT